VQEEEKLRLVCQDTKCGTRNTFGRFEFFAWNPCQKFSHILIETGLGATNRSGFAQTNATIGRLEPFKTVNLAVKK
jgi:hypothetical protein